jgi:endonuclease/exonuclease/phosphatase family metal-dependent hydrolase
MPTTFKIATFNAENLFTRAKVFNKNDPTIGDDAIKNIGELQKELERTTYDKAKIMSLYNKVKDYVTVSEDRNKLWKMKGRKIAGVLANGTGDWDGSLVFKRAKFNTMARQNTAKVVLDVKADLLCMVEVENKPALSAFNSHLLRSRYNYNMLIDAMDPRGIDVAMYSKFPFGGVWTHMYEKKGTSRIFSRDCLEVEVFLPNGQPLYMLCNHFKSKGYGATSTSNAKRKMQAERVAEILRSDYDLDSEFAVVTGDFNDTDDSDPLKPLFTISELKDVLNIQYPNEPAKRWTYHYKKNEQIDFMLISKALQRYFVQAGISRKGIHDLAQFSGGAEKPYDTVTSKANQASDHGAVWAEFRM